MAVIVAAGGSASDRVKFGVEGNGWFATSSDTTMQYLAASVVASVFLFERLPLNLQGGIGLGRYAEDGGGDLLTSSGFHIQVGAGYDVPLSAAFSIRPYIRYVFSNNLPATLNRQPQFTPMDHKLLHFGASLVFQKL